MAEKALIRKSAGLIGLIGLGVLAGAAGYLVGGMIPKRSLDWLAPADVAALAIAALLAVVACIIWSATFSETRFKRMVEFREDPDPVDPAAIRSVRLQAGVLAAAAVLLAGPVLADGAGLAGAGERSAIFVALALGALLVWESLVNWRIWREGDELTRNIVLVTGALCFWGMQLALFAYAGSVRLGLAPDVGSWALITIMMAIYLIVASVVAVRRGFGKP